MEKEMNKELEKAYDEGFSRRHFGDVKDSNPYRKGTELAQFWDLGWVDADIYEEE